MSCFDRPVTPSLDTESFKSSLAREETNPATAAAECGVEEVAGLVEAAQLGEKETMSEIEIFYIQYKDERLFWRLRSPINQHRNVRESWLCTR